MRESGANVYAIEVKRPSVPVTVVDQLPEGMVFIPGVHPDWECTISTDAAVEDCTSSAPPTSALTLYVHVDPDAKNPSTNVAKLCEGEGTSVTEMCEAGKLSGGGVVRAETVVETTVAAAVPFGIWSFTAVALREPTEALTELPELPNNVAKPEVQAGGHPFAYSSDIAFNYTTGDNLTTPPPGNLGPAGGVPKEVQVELPPGFVGNPQNMPRCPLARLHGGLCPKNTAVGYVHVTLSHSKIEHGKAHLQEPLGTGNSILLYNLAPAPGHPAAFGFLVAESTAIVLEVDVRSDGDYGVTVGGISSNILKLLVTNVTTCENGASKAGATVSCNKAPPSAKPFLTNPTECASPEAGVTAAPVTTASANSWEDPAGHASIEAYTNAPSAHYSEVNRPPTQGTREASSLLTGCDQLLFGPQLQFEPSPPAEGGTTQADEPTGMTIDLKLPQTNEAQLAATPELKNVAMTLPAGVTASPSAADGLGACSDTQFGLGTEFGPGSKHSEPAKPAECPLDSQIGTVEVFTPLLSGAPTIEGVPNAQQHQVLTCSQGRWNRSPTTTNYSYQWLRSGAPIPAATGTEFALGPADEGKALQCQVTASNEGGSSVAVSRDAVVEPEPKPPAPPPPFPPSSIAAPSGIASPGHALTCETEPWTESPLTSTPVTPTLEYRWLRGGVEIPGAGGPGPGGASYTLVGEDAGKVIQCQVRGSDASGETIADSAAVVASPVPSPPPPLPGAALQGEMFQGQPECSPCTPEDAVDGKMLRLFLQIQNPGDGVIVKLHGTTSADPVTGQLKTSFVEQPQQPFELLQVKLKGGPRAPLANPQTCGAATTTSDLTPWSAPGLGGLSGSEPVAGTPDATPFASFNVDFNGAGEPCPATLPFSPSFNAGTIGPAAASAGASTDFTVTFGRQDREQDLSGITVHMPPGLVGKIPAVTLCGQAEALAEEQEAATEGHNRPHVPGRKSDRHGGLPRRPRPDPFRQEGQVYLTGPYKGAPFGLLVDTPAEAARSTSATWSCAHDHGGSRARPRSPSPPIRCRSSWTACPAPARNQRHGHQAGLHDQPDQLRRTAVAATLGGLQGASADEPPYSGSRAARRLPFTPTFTVSTQGQRANRRREPDVKVTYPQGATRTSPKPSPNCRRCCPRG